MTNLLKPCFAVGSMFKRPTRHHSLHSHCAAKAGHGSTIELLLRYNAELEAKDSAGRTALMHAAMNGQAQAVRTLLDKGADIGATDRQKRNTVIHAASGSHGDTLAVLLQCGADPEHVDDTGKTASMYAAANNDPPVLSLLLSHMSHVVSPRALDKDGRSVLDYVIANEKATLQDKKATEKDKRAALQDKKDVLAMLLEGRFGVRQNKHSLQAVRRAALGGQNEILTILIAHKANVNATDDNGRTALHFLASDTTKDPFWNEQTVIVLLEAGVDVFKIDHDRATGRRRTALQWAAATGRQVVAKAILRDMKVGFVKAHVNSASSRGKTAMHLAAQHNNADMIRLLRNHDANIDPRSEGDWTPLLIAAKAGHFEAVEALLGASESANINARNIKWHDFVALGCRERPQSSLYREFCRMTHPGKIQKIPLTPPPCPELTVEDTEPSLSSSRTVFSPCLLGMLATLATSSLRQS